MSPAVVLLGSADSIESVGGAVIPVLLGFLALWLMLPPSDQARRAMGGVLGIVALGFLAGSAPQLPNLGEAFVFWIVAGVTIVAAVATVCAVNPVYSAIWFALSLLGTAGLFLFQGAQFLGVATVVVYAGAIIVTFLFVLMLAQPEGRAPFDRLSWGDVPKVMSVIAAACIVGVLTFALIRLRVDGIGTPAIGRFEQGSFRQQVALTLSGIEDEQGQSAILADRLLRARLREFPTGSVLFLEFRDTPIPSSEGQFDKLDFVKILGRDPSVWTYLPDDISFEVDVADAHGNVNHQEHMAHFGAEMFSRHLLSVEVAGALLLIALVGAVAIVIQGKDVDVDVEGGRDEHE